MVTTKKQISITLDKKLLEKIDKERGLIARSKFIENKLEKII